MEKKRFWMTLCDISKVWRLRKLNIRVILRIHLGLGLSSGPWLLIPFQKSPVDVRQSRKLNMSGKVKWIYEHSRIKMAPVFIFVPDIFRHDCAFDWCKLLWSFKIMFNLTEMGFILNSGWEKKMMKNSEQNKWIVDFNFEIKSFDWFRMRLFVIRLNGKFETECFDKFGSSSVW